MAPQELSKSDVVKIIDQLDKLLLSFPLDSTLQKACLAKRRSEHSYKRAPSYMEVASMKLKQDVESSWKCLFVSANEGESGAQQAFCYVKSLSLFLRVGCFVDAKEEKSECKLCERGGFVTSSGIYYLPYSPCM